MERDSQPTVVSSAAGAGLVMQQGPAAGQYFPLDKTVVTVGRSTDNDIVVDQADVSRYHMRLTWTGSHFVIEDLGSANGTFVNGVRLTTSHPLEDRDVIMLGRTVSFLVSVPGAARPSRPEGLSRPTEEAVRSRILWPLAVLVSFCCLISLVGGLGYVAFTRRPAGRPVVWFTAPDHGTQVEVGQEVMVHSIARDENKISRMELWIDGQLLETHRSELQGGTSPFPLVTNWIPAAAGRHTLLVRAFNTEGRRGHTSIEVNATEKSDRDGDGVPDEADRCPEEAGFGLAAGCPDADLDGIPDLEDLCPDVSGVPEDGCPRVDVNDRDGDGLLDEIDACPEEAGPPPAAGCPDRDADGIRDSDDLCPDEAGFPEDGCPRPDDADGDGIPDVSDACPEEWGMPEHSGCPDSDGDGIRDSDDTCPDEAGLAEHSGCPDADGDGVRDCDDACPHEPGPPESHGCPGEPGGDRDGDGVPDGADACPEEAGLPEAGGCPPPGEGADSDEDGVPDEEEAPTDPLDGWDLEPLLPGLPGAWAVVEFEALELEVDREYDEMYFYGGTAGAVMERFGPLNPLGDRQWNIGEVLGGENSRRLTVPLMEPLELRAEGAAYEIFPEPEGAWATYFDLGSVTMSHPNSEWDGRVLEVESEGVDGHGFRFSYRLCLGSCDEAALRPPTLSLFHGMGDSRLIWYWEGDRADIDGFKLYVNDHFVFTLPAGSYSHSVRFFRPPCGDRYTFELTAYRGDAESPCSNTAYWSGDRCPRTVQVTFVSIETSNLGRDEGHRGEDRAGPITGSFWVSGRGEESRIDFDACACRMHPFDWACHGYLLRDDTSYVAQSILDWILREQDSCLGLGCMANRYCVSDASSSLIVELGARDSLTFGAHIRDCDYWTSHDTLFRGQLTLTEDEVLPGEYTIRNRGIELRVRVDELAGP